MSLSKAVSSLQLSEDHDSKLELAKRYVKYMISGNNSAKFKYVHCAANETWVVILDKQDLKTGLMNQAGEIVFGPPESCLRHRVVYVKVDSLACTVHVKQVDDYSDGRREKHDFVILPRPTPQSPLSGGEFIGNVPKAFASYLVLQDPELLVSIARNLDLGWSIQIVDY